MKFSCNHHNHFNINRSVAFSTVSDICNHHVYLFVSASLLFVATYYSTAWTDPTGSLVSVGLR